MNAPHANATRLAVVLENFFTTKTACDVEGTMAYFSPDMVAYIDATLGWDFDSFDALKAVFEQYMPTWAPPARSYATKILAGDDSALIHMVDTPELFGGELRILAAVDFSDGKIVRWVDYWDSSTYDTDLYHRFRTPEDRFPTDLKDTQVDTPVVPALREAGARVHQALSAGDPTAAATSLHPDVVLVDRAQRTQILGRIEVSRYLQRAVDAAPYGHGSMLRHVVGGRNGGAFEWTAAPEAGGLAGITALELDDDGLITSVISTYDSRALDPTRQRALADVRTR